MAAAGVVLVAFGGCGDADEPSPRVSAAPSSIAESEDVAKFRVLANDVCATVTQGAPQPLSPAAGPDAVKRYARASARVSQAMAESLRRLPTPQSLRPSVAALARAYRGAQREYATIGRADVTVAAVGSVTTTLRVRESAILAQASAAGLPACAGALSR